MITAQRLVRGPWASPCHPSFEGSKGMITKGIAPVSAIPASMIAPWSFSSLLQWRLLFQRLVNDSISWKDLGHLANIFQGARE